MKRKNTLTVILAGMLVLAIMVSPVVMGFSESAFAQTSTSNISKSPVIGIDKGRGGDHGGGRGGDHKKAPAEVVITLLSKWSGIGTETLESTMKDYDLNVAGIINAVVLSKAGDISLDEAAQIVADRKLREYIDENDLQEKFMQVRHDFAEYMRNAAKEYRERHKKEHRVKGSPAVRAKVWSDFTNVLANWAGTSTQDIVSIQEKYGLNPARTVNAVVLAKVAGIDLTVSASIVANGELRTYIEENNLQEAFQTARQEVMSLLRETAQELREKAEEKIAEALAGWSGFAKDDIQKLIDEKNVPYAITVVVLAKVGNMSLDEAQKIADKGIRSVFDYLRKNGLLREFLNAKKEVSAIIRDILKP